MHERVQLCQDPRTEFALLRESLGVSRINHILRVHGHTILQEQRAADIYDEVGQRSLERLFPRFAEDSNTQASTPGGTHSSQAAHPGDDTRCSHSWLLPSEPLETRLATVIETATSSFTYLNALDDEDKATAKLCVQKAARQQTRRGSKPLEVCKDPASLTRPYQTSNIPTLPLRTKTAMTWTSQRPGRGNSMHRSSKRSFHGSPIGLDSGVRRAHSSPRERGSRSRGLRICATHLSPTSGSTITWTSVREVLSRPTTTSPTCRKDLETGRGQDLARHRLSHVGTQQRLRSRCGVRCETRRPRHHHGTQRAHSNAIAG